MVSYKLIMLAVAAVPVTAAGVYAGKKLIAGESAATTPAGIDLMAKLRDARDGAVIKLEAKDYGLVTAPPVAHASPVRIEAGPAHFTGLVLSNLSGIAIDGGTIVGPSERKSYGVTITNSDGVTVSGMTISGAHNGIVLYKSSNVALLSNTLTGLLSDGIDIGLSRKVVVRGNSCSNFSPTMDSYDATGKLLQGGGDHPDCIQAFSRPEVAPNADLVIEKNRAEGKMQGIFLGNHQRGGVDDGGYDRVIVRDNVVKVSLYNGIAVMNARDGIVTGNTVSTLPGSFNPKRPTQPIRAWLRIDGGERMIVCGNTVTDFPRDASTAPCRGTDRR